VITAAAIELWLLDRARQQPLLAGIEAQYPRLPAADLTRAAAMADQRRAELWLAGRTAVRLLLEARLGRGLQRAPFEQSPSGRPSIANCGFDFSLSDCGPFLLIGISACGRIGVDIEAARVIQMSAGRLPRLIASGEALGHHRSGATRITPLQAWTRIEAFAKASAPGVAVSLEALGVSGRAGDPETLADVRARARLHCIDVGVHVHDLSLTGNLIGALAQPRLASAAAETPPIVRDLDEPAIRHLAK
jgi:phosphopantetheinyl transferase